MVPHSKKRQKKKKAQNNPFQFSFTLPKCFVVSHLLAFNDFEVVISNKNLQILLRNDQSHDVKNNRSEHLVSK